VVSFTPRPLYPQGKSPWYPLDKRLDGLYFKIRRRIGYASELGKIMEKWQFFW
jgi:hypothetical protein